MTPSPGFPDSRIPEIFNSLVHLFSGLWSQVPGVVVEYFVDRLLGRVLSNKYQQGNKWDQTLWTVPWPKDIILEDFDDSLNREICVDVHPGQLS